MQGSDENSSEKGVQRDATGLQVILPVRVVPVTGDLFLNCHIVDHIHCFGLAGSRTIECEDLKVIDEYKSLMVHVKIKQIKALSQAHHNEINRPPPQVYHSVIVRPA